MRNVIQGDIVQEYNIRELQLMPDDNDLIDSDYNMIEYNGTYENAIPDKIRRFNIL